MVNGGAHRGSPCCTLPRSSVTVYRIISLFSGCGGLDYGLKAAGNEIVWANDIDRDAVATYRQNVDARIVCGDIKDIDAESIPAGDVVVGGFPCQGFSLANLKRQVEDARNRLYSFFYQTIKAKQPKFFIAENVKGILSLGKGEIIKQIVSDFANAGYLVEVHLVNMADYGVPQTRQRVIIVGQRKDLADAMLFRFPVKTHSKHPKGNEKRWVSIQAALAHFPEPSEACGIPNHVGSQYKIAVRNFTGHRPTNPDLPSPTILARGNGGGGVVAIPHYNGLRRLTIRESATIQTFPEDFVFIGSNGSCYRQVGNAVPVLFGRLLGDELVRLSNEV